MYPNLKLEIFKRGIRQNHLARELGLNEANLSKIINGYREPSSSLKQTMADFLKADVAWLFQEYVGHTETPVSASERSSPNGNDSKS